MANPGKRKEALPAFHFEVTVGKASYPFRSCSGIKSETKVYEVEEGGSNYHVHKLPGQTTFPPLVLRQGFCDPSSPLYQMYLEFISEGKPKRRFDGVIKQIGPNGTSAKWQFRGGWISKWEGPDLDATKNEVSIEAIEICHEGIYLVGAGGAAGAAGGAAGSGSSSGGFGASVSSIFGGGGGGVLGAAGGALGGAAGGAAGSAIGGAIGGLGGGSSSSGSSSSSTSSSSSSSSSTSSSSSSSSSPPPPTPPGGGKL